MPVTIVTMHYQIMINQWDQRAIEYKAGKSFDFTDHDFHLLTKQYVKYVFKNETTATTWSALAAVSSFHLCSGGWLRSTVNHLIFSLKNKHHVIGL